MAWRRRDDAVESAREGAGRTRKDQPGQPASHRSEGGLRPSVLSFKGSISIDPNAAFSLVRTLISPFDRQADSLDGVVLPAKELVVLGYIGWLSASIIIIARHG